MSRTPFTSTPGRSSTWPIKKENLYIHTSAGSFRYTVEGTGTPNPYRIQVTDSQRIIIIKSNHQYFLLQPLVGVKLPLNSSYSPVIQIHNPHQSTIQVRSENPGAPSSNKSRCWRCTPAGATFTWSCPRVAWRRTTACGRSRPTTPSRS